MPINAWSDDILIVELNDEPAFSEDLENLLRRVDQMPAPLPDVILDLQNVSYMNSSNIAQLLKVRKRLISASNESDHKIGLRICGVNDQVWSVLLVTGLDSVFKFTDDVATALASLQIEAEG